MSCGGRAVFCMQTCNCTRSN